MTAKALATLLHARKVGKDKWMAICPGHRDRHASLSIAVGKRVPVLLRCMSNGCDTRDILGAMGLRYGDLFDGEPTREVQIRLNDEQMRERLERQLGLVIMLQATEPKKLLYWRAAERRIRDDLQHVRCRLEPLKMMREFRERQWAVMNLSQREKTVEAAWKIWSRNRH